MEKLSWDAVRKGDIYCAPACGRDCTHAEYLEAHAKADALIAKCKEEVGGEWEKNIHENLGWHFCVTLKDGNITVREYGENHYAVSSHGGGTPVTVSVRETGSSIKKLVLAQINAVKREADRWNDYLERNMKSLKLKSL